MEMAKNGVFPDCNFLRSNLLEGTLSAAARLLSLGSTTAWGTEASTQLCVSTQMWPLSHFQPAAPVQTIVPQQSGKRLSSAALHTFSAHQCSLLPLLSLSHSDSFSLSLWLFLSLTLSDSFSDPFRLFLWLFLSLSLSDYFSLSLTLSLSDPFWLFLSDSLSLAAVRPVPLSVHTNTHAPCACVLSSQDTSTQENAPVILPLSKIWWITNTFYLVPTSLCSSSLPSLSTVPHSDSWPDCLTSSTRAHRPQPTTNKGLSADHQ